MQHTKDGDRIETNQSLSERSLSDYRLEVKDLLDLPDLPVPWRCHDLAADGFLTVLAGAGGEGKSMLALALAKGVAQGSPVAGIECTPGKALIFDAENGKHEMARRVRALKLPDAGVILYESGSFDLQRQPEQFREAILQEGANLVVIDSLRRHAPKARENESDSMTPLMADLSQISRETGAAMILVHHRGKNGGAFRGSSVILDQADLLFALAREENDPNGKLRRCLTAAKVRIAPEPEDRWLTIRHDDETGLVTVEAADSFNGVGRSSLQTVADQLLMHLTQDPQPQAALARAIGRGEGNGTVNRALNWLADERLAERADGGWKLVIHPSDPLDSEWMDEDSLTLLEAA